MWATQRTQRVALSEEAAAGGQPGWVSSPSHSPAQPRGHRGTQMQAPQGRDGAGTGMCSPMRSLILQGLRGSGVPTPRTFSHPALPPTPPIPLGPHLLCLPTLSLLAFPALCPCIHALMPAPGSPPDSLYFSELNRRSIFFGKFLWCLSLASSSGLG